ncbi:MAG: adenylate kinase [Parcubacteria bacterium C7867-006]|nr:MAG: adenylate kinase [Parcubacteria bacterium C7867-006]
MGPNSGHVQRRARLNTYVSVVWGGVASGKGELTRRLSAEGEHVIISTSDEIRKHQARMSPSERILVIAQMKAGKLYDDLKMIDLLDRRLEEVGEVSSIILDGFPRNSYQAAHFIEAMVDSGRYRLGSIMLLELKRETARKRFFGRMEKEDRLDNDEKVFDDRFDEFEKLLVPMMKYFTEIAKVKVDIVDAEKDEAGVEAQARTILSRRLSLPTLSAAR